MNTVEAIKHLFLDTGAAWVLWLLAALSVTSLAIAIERFEYYRKNSADLRQLASELHARLEHGDTNATIAWLGSSPAVAARIAAAGLRLSDRGPAAVDKAMISRTALERDA